MSSLVEKHAMHYGAFPTKCLGNQAKLTCPLGAKPGNEQWMFSCKNPESCEEPINSLQGEAKWSILCSLMEIQLICTRIQRDNVMSSDDWRSAARQESISSGGWKHPILPQVFWRSHQHWGLSWPSGAGTGKPQQLYSWNCKVGSLLLPSAQGGPAGILGKNSRWVQQTETFPRENLTFGWWGWSGQRNLQDEQGEVQLRDSIADSLQNFPADSSKFP